VAQQLAALRFLFVKALKKPWSIDETPYPKRPSTLPDILSQEERWRDSLMPHSRPFTASC